MQNRQEIKMQSIGGILVKVLYQVKLCLGFASKVDEKTITSLKAPRRLLERVQSVVDD